MKTETLVRIMQLGDSVLPVGAFAFSNGVESAIQCGVITDRASLYEFTLHTLQQAASGDARGAVSCARAVQAGDWPAAILHDKTLYNRRLNEESRIMLTRMGKKLAEFATTVIQHDLTAWWLQQIRDHQTPGTYPISQAVVMSILGVAPREVAMMNLYGLATSLLSAALRLMRITHIETQHLLFDLSTEIDVLCTIAEQGNLDNMASWAPETDVLAAMHVNAYTRLFSN